MQTAFSMSLNQFAAHPNMEFHHLEISDLHWPFWVWGVAWVLTVQVQLLGCRINAVLHEVAKAFASMCYHWTMDEPKRTHPIRFFAPEVDLESEQRAEAIRKFRKFASVTGLCRINSHTILLYPTSMAQYLTSSYFLTIVCLALISFVLLSFLLYPIILETELWSLLCHCPYWPTDQFKRCLHLQTSAEIWGKSNCPWMYLPTAVPIRYLTILKVHIDEPFVLGRRQRHRNTSWAQL